MTTDEILVAWATKKYAYALDGETVARVALEHEEGWAGTDVTPGDAASLTVRVYDKDGLNIHTGYAEYGTDLINEILSVATGA